MNRSKRSAPAEQMSRRSFMATAALGAVAAGTSRQDGVAAICRLSTAARRVPEAFELEELDISALQTGMTEGRWTAVRLVELYSDRIRQLDRSGPMLRSVLEVNPDAPAIAAGLDRERAAGRVRGPMHGIPILLKDNVDTADRMTTTAGSLALEGSRPSRDAFLAERLRAAGAVILGKTNLSEWANMRSSRSSSGWSSRGGQVRNPCVLDRTPCGSSSGTGAAVAANLVAVGVGTETDGSITCPSATVGLVGLKPTVGLVSRSGIIPISHTQDTAGPMCRTVADAAVLLSAIVGPDPRDPATAAASRFGGTDYTRALDADGLKGARLGVTRKRFTGYHDATDRLFEEALEVLRGLGATIIDPAELPHAGDYDTAEYQVLLYDFKADLNAYLAGLPAGPWPRTLAEIIAFNERERDRVMPYFAQETMHEAQEKGPLTSPAYRRALATCRRLSRAEGIDAVLQKHRLDALIAPTGNPAWPIDLVNGDHFTGSVTTPAAVAGYPHITVPMGNLYELPVGLSFFGTAWTEAKLLRYAFAYEQATHHRVPPGFLPTLSAGPGEGGAVERGR